MPPAGQGRAAVVYTHGVGTIPGSYALAAAYAAYADTAAHVYGGGSDEYKSANKKYRAAVRNYCVIVGVADTHDATPAGGARGLYQQPPRHLVAARTSNSPVP